MISGLKDLGIDKKDEEFDQIYDDMFKTEQKLDAIIIDEIVEDSASKNLDEIWMDILNKILAFYAKSKGKTHKGLFELHLKEGKSFLNEDWFVWTIVAEMNKEISSIDVEYLAKSYCLKRED